MIKLRLLFVGLILILSNLFLGCAKSTMQLSDAEQKIIAKVKAENPNCTCEPYLTKYSKNNEVYYVLQYKGPACATIPTLFDASGNQLINIANPFPDFFKDAILIKDVWTCQ